MGAVCEKYGIKLLTYGTLVRGTTSVVSCTDGMICADRWLVWRLPGGEMAWKSRAETVCRRHDTEPEKVL